MKKQDKIRKDKIKAEKEKAKANKDSEDKTEDKKDDEKQDAFNYFNLGCDIEVPEDDWVDKKENDKDKGNSGSGKIDKHSIAPTVTRATTNDVIDRGYTIRRGLSVAAAIDENTGNLVLSNTNNNQTQYWNQTERGNYEKRKMSDSTFSSENCIYFLNCLECGCVCGGSNGKVAVAK